MFRSRPFVAGAIFFTYQDHRTPNALQMGVVDAWRRRGSWAALREAYAPAVLDAVRMSRLSDGTQGATVVLRARGPVERDLPAYALQGYRLEWVVAAPGGQRVFAEGVVALPTLPPGAIWSEALEWNTPPAEGWLTLRLLRPTGVAAFEQTYDADGRRQ